MQDYRKLIHFFTVIDYSNTIRTYDAHAALSIVRSSKYTAIINNDVEVFGSIIIRERTVEIIFNCLPLPA